MSCTHARALASGAASTGNAWTEGVRAGCSWALWFALTRVLWPVALLESTWAEGVHARSLVRGGAAIVICNQGAPVARVGDGAAIVICNEGRRAVGASW